MSSDGPSGDVGIPDEVRVNLIALIRKGRRSSKFRTNQPTDWRPTRVLRRYAELDSHFTSNTAWDFIAAKLEEGHPVETIALRRPPGAKGYVMKIELEPARRPLLYVKLQLNSGKVYGRSFKDSDYD